MSWIPSSGPFPYLHEAFDYLETNYCSDCVFRKIGESQGPMCWTIEGKILLEDEPVEEIVTATRGVVCTKYKQGDPTPPQLEGQEVLF